MTSSVKVIVFNLQGIPMDLYKRVVPLSSIGSSYAYIDDVNTLFMVYPPNMDCEFLMLGEDELYQYLLLKDRITNHQIIEHFIQLSQGN